MVRARPGGQVVATTVIQIFNGAGLHAYLYNGYVIYIYMYVYIFTYIVMGTDTKKVHSKFRKIESPMESLNLNLHQMLGKSEKMYCTT